ncbi:cilia- and flagella-associated protein 99 isoform X2 [Xiphophorus maculatus]|uniref:cilia- and flagella-associated protein 99 isoform X2 n=1 Tax=Xiphophorus maculatus TaxID=8083 RepID=UPI000C6CFFF6|nr:cilia- and flagella-associated protein 99 isoform X2 [Xiphophorus maculatus]
MSTEKQAVGRNVDGLPVNQLATDLSDDLKMSSGFGSLVKVACMLLDKFSSDPRCVDEFVEDISTDLQGSFDPLESKFILKVVSGCVEYEKLLDIVINTFYGQHRKWLCKSDRNQFIIICYLCMFSLDELGLEHFSTIIKSLGHWKMHFFLDFFFSSITTWVQAEWNTFYDPEFVEKHLIANLLRWRPEINHLMDQLSKKERRARTKPTQCQDFILSKNKLPTPPKEELSPLPDKFTPVPSSTYMTPRELQKIQECKEKNQKKAEELLHAIHFTCRDPEKSEETESVISQIKAEGNAKMKSESFQARRISCSFKVVSHPVKLNNAAIWRREALHDRLVKEELHRIEELVQGSTDLSPFLQRQKELEERERQEKRQKEERTRLETQITEQEIALNRLRIAEQKHEAVQRKKEETARIMQRYAKKRLKEEKEVRHIVQQVMEDRINLKVAQERSKKIKQKIVKEVSEENQELLRQALEEQEEELRKRFQIVHEIRAIKSLHIVKPNNFNDTETAGYELLGEMSLAELKERLALLRQNQQKEEEERRSNILQEKLKKQQQILETLDNINLYSQLLTKEAADRKEERRVQQELLKQVVAEDSTIVALKKKLEDKKQELHKVKETERSRAKLRQRFASRASIQRESRETTWEELEQSLAHYVQDAE